MAAAASLVSKVIFPMVEQVLLPHGVVWLSAASCVLALLLVLSSIPETRHKELGDIPAKFAVWRSTFHASICVQLFFSKERETSIALGHSCSHPKSQQVAYFLI